MEKLLETLEHFTGTLSNVIWPIFLPILLLAAIFIIYKGLKMRKLYKDEIMEMRARYIIGPVSISLGAMIGTGAIIGVLGSISKLSLNNQIYVESIAFWAVLGGLLLVPVCYFETYIAKLMNLPANEYIGKLVHPLAGRFYTLSFITLYVFGFGGFQFSGIQSAISVITERITGYSFSSAESYMYIVIPLIVFVMAVVLTKKHNVFISVMAYMIGIVVALYFVFFFLFVGLTIEYIPVFLDRMIMGIQNPISYGIGVPVGFVLSLQRVIQCSETGLGALGMASLEADSKPKAASIISVIPTVITIFVAVIVTSYITSYGVHMNLISLVENGTVTSVTERLAGYFETSALVTGDFGFYVLIIFTICSGITTLLGSFYYLTTLTTLSENRCIVFYFLLLFTAGTLAVFGFTIVFDVVDLLLFVVTGLNVLALVRYMMKHSQEKVILVEKKAISES